jgi:hypothetical protein
VNERRSMPEPLPQCAREKDEFINVIEPLPGRTKFVEAAKVRSRGENLHLGVDAQFTMQALHITFDALEAVSRMRTDQ